MSAFVIEVSAFSLKVSVNVKEVSTFIKKEDVNVKKVLAFVKEADDFTIKVANFNNKIDILNIIIHYPSVFPLKNNYFIAYMENILTFA